MPQIIQPLLKQLETRSQVTDSISQPAMAAAIEAAQNGSGSPTVAIPCGWKTTTTGSWGYHDTDGQ